MESASAAPAVRLSTRVADLPGVGPQRAAALARLGITTLTDLIRHLPARYERQSAEGTINDLTLDTIGSARGTLVATRWIPSGGRGKGRFQATLQDHVGR